MTATMLDCDFKDCYVISEEHVDLPLYVDLDIYSRPNAINIQVLRDILTGGKPLNQVTVKPPVGNIVDPRDICLLF